MNKELEGKRAWSVVKWIMRAVAVIFGLFVLLVLLGTIPFQFAGLLLFGWIAFLGRVIPQITFNPEIAFDAAIALALALFGLHRILCWWTKQGGDESAKWRFGWTLKTSVMVLLLFATSIAAVGMVHQIAWLSREPRLIYMTGRGKQTVELSNMKQAALALTLFASDHDGQFPKKLDELIPDYLSNHKLLFTIAVDGDPPQPIIYYTGYNTRDDQVTIVLATPFELFGGHKRVVAYLDSSAVVISEVKYQELIQKQKMSAQGR